MLSTCICSVSECLGDHNHIDEKHTPSNKAYFSPTGVFRHVCSPQHGAARHCRCHGSSTEYSLMCMYVYVCARASVQRSCRSACDTFIGTSQRLHPRLQLDRPIGQTLSFFFFGFLAKLRSLPDADDVVGEAGWLRT
jgi:hypothetical protein